MARLTLALAFAVAGTAILQDKLFEVVGRESIPFLDMALMLPAVILGAIYWWRGRSYASCWPVVACAGLVWISLLYPNNVERLRGFLIATLLTLPLPLAALVVEKRAWALCAKVYVWSNAAAMLVALWLESRVEHDLFKALGRFGFLATADGTGYTSNPNQVGGQLAFASIVAFIVYLKSCEQTRESRGSILPDVYLVLMVLLSGGAMLTASRGAFLSWLPAAGLLFVLGTGKLPMSRMRDLVAVSMAGLIVAVGLMVAGQTTPWGRLQERFGDDRTMGNFSSRGAIWAGAWKAWHSHPDFLWRGTGIGMADDVLGLYSPMAEEDEGVLRKNCHNAGVEWVLSLGLVGILAAGCLAASVTFQSLRLDGDDRNVGRTAMIVCVALFAMTAVSYRHKCWPAVGTLVLASLSEPASRRRKRDDEEEAHRGTDDTTGRHHLAGPRRAAAPALRRTTEPTSVRAGPSRSRASFDVHT